MTIRYIILTFRVITVNGTVMNRVKTVNESVKNLYLWVETLNY